MRLNSFGQIVADKWIRSVEIRQEIDFDEWVDYAQSYARECGD